MWLNISSPLTQLTPHWGQVEPRDHFFGKLIFWKEFILDPKWLFTGMQHILKCMYIFYLETLLSCPDFKDTSSKNCLSSPHCPLYETTEVQQCKLGLKCTQLVLNRMGIKLKCIKQLELKLLKLYGLTQTVVTGG